MSESEGNEAVALDQAVTEANAVGELTVREKVLDLLLDKIRDDKYPSATMMDDVEQLLTPWRRQEYADVLMEKVLESRYPSRTLVQRLLRLSG